MERKKYYRKKMTQFGYLCGCVTLASAGFFSGEEDTATRVMLWTGTALFSLSALALLVQMLRSGPWLVLSEEGLFARALGVPIIPWTSILRVETTGLKKTTYIVLRLADEEKWIARLSMKGRALASYQKMSKGDVFNLSLVWLNASPQEIAASILAFKARYNPDR